jgi:N-acetylneuraminic acid mutarotase
MNFLKPLLYFLFASLLLSCNTPADSPYSPIIFNKRATMSGSGRASAVAFVIDGKGYVALGRTTTRSGALNDCWQYDPTKNDSCWKRKADFPGIARVKATAAVVNGKAYVGLGFNIALGVYNTEACLKDFWMYDPITDSWEQKANFLNNFTDACACFVVNNTIYVTSGMDGAGFGNEVWKYIPVEGQQGTWVRLNDFSGPSRAGGIACANSNHVYFGTGYWTFNANDWWEYFPINDTWVQRRLIPDNGRENAVSLTINNRIFVSTGRHFGGNLTGGHVDSDIIEYDIIRNVWFDRGNLPASGRENALSFTINGKGYIGFGENDTQVLNDFWSFEP